MRCLDCDGYGIVADYGLFGDDFYGDKECKECEGTGRIYHRSMWETKKELEKKNGKQASNSGS